MSKLDDDLQRIVEHGYTQREFAKLMRRHRKWFDKVAWAQWHRWPSSQTLHDVDDVRQMAVFAVWRALESYRWICASRKCRRGGVEWSTGEYEEWEEHVCTMHPPGPMQIAVHLPRVDVGRYVRFSVRVWTDTELKRTAAIRRTASIVSLDECSGVSVHSNLAARIVLRELVEQARVVLEPTAQRMFSYLTAGHSQRQAVALEIARHGDVAVRSEMAAAARKAKKFVSNAADLLL